MVDFFSVRPDAIKSGFGNTIFYYGVQPHGLSQLPVFSEFTLVYSPSQDYGWEVVHYRVLQPDKTYFVVYRRSLSPEETQHFEQLLESVPRHTSDDHLSNQQPPLYAVSVNWRREFLSRVKHVQELLTGALAFTFLGSIV